MKIIALLLVTSLTSSFLIHKEPEADKKRSLALDDAAIDVRATLQQKESDNPLNELWDINHIRVARQKLNMNMNVPLNRVKLQLSKDYVVKIVVHSDEDYMALQNYFNPPE